MVTKPVRSVPAVVQRGVAAWDAAAWVTATLTWVLARYEFELRSVQWAMVLVYAACAGLAQLLLGIVTHIYRGRHHLASYHEAVHLGVIAIGIGLVAGVTFSAMWPAFPRGVVLSVPAGALLAMVGGRAAVRALTSYLIRSRQPRDAERVLVYGAGDGGRILARMLSDDLNAPYEIVGYLDDDPGAAHREFGRARVLGGRAELPRLAAELGVRTMILAIPSAPSELIRRISQDAERARLTLLILPKVQDIVGRTIGVAPVRRLEIADILGRGQVSTDLESIAGYISGRVVLVTGAGGSIGSELAKQLSRLGASSLVLLDRDESALHAVQLEIQGIGLLDTRDFVLCDIRDAEALERVFSEHEPDVVFHAAALKHLPMLESYPAEGWKTNVLGTLNVLEAAARHGVTEFVNISTDKAADPISVLGKTKRLAEELTASFAKRTGRRYVSVRFGNVLGSRGSVLHTFNRQIDKGGPLTVVHPEITRYFMTIPEACQLTIQAGAIGEPGDVLILDMGEPVRIVDLARRIIRESGRSIDIVFTGLRRGEKLHETLFSEGEDVSPTKHPLISRVPVPPREPASVRSVIPERYLSWAGKARPA